MLLPFLITVGLVCIDFGRFAHQYIAVTNAARAGASYAATNPRPEHLKGIWNAGVKQTVSDELAANTWFDVTKLTVPPPQVQQEVNGMKRISITVSYPFNTIIDWPFLPNYSDPIILRRTIVAPLTR